MEALDRPKLAKLLNLTRSDNDHEALIAMRRANALAGSMDWAKILEQPKLIGRSQAYADAMAKAKPAPPPPPPKAKGDCPYNTSGHQFSAGTCNFCDADDPEYCEDNPNYDNHVFSPKTMECIFCGVKHSGGPGSYHTAPPQNCAVLGHSWNWSMIHVRHQCSRCGTLMVSNPTQCAKVKSQNHDFWQGKCRHCGTADTRGKPNAGGVCTNHLWILNRAANVIQCQMCAHRLQADPKRCPNHPAMAHEWVGGKCARCGQPDVDLHSLTHDAIEDMIFVCFNKVTGNAATFITSIKIQFESGRSLSPKQLTALKKFYDRCK